MHKVVAEENKSPEQKFSPGAFVSTTHGVKRNSDVEL